MRIRSDTRLLREYEEVIGLFRKVSTEDGITVANIGGVNVMLPEETIRELQPYLRKRVAVLRTDLPGREYLVRVCDESSCRILGANASQEAACA